MVSTKSRLAACLFALFLGVFGIHRFYVGKTGTGCVQLLLTISGIGFWLSSIWVLLDWIVITTGGFKDKDGLMITRW